jgi:hypothetical protein
MKEQIGGLFWLAISIFVCTESIKSEIGSLSAPGPGFLPFWSAVILGLFAISFIIYSTVKNGFSYKVADMWRGLQWGKVIAVICSLFLYAILLSSLGYVITTFALMFFVISIIDSARFFRHGISAASISVASYVVFQMLLDVKLPRGIFGF